MEQDKFTISNITKASVWSLSYFSLLFCTVISAILVIIYLYMIKPYVIIPADILMWAETNFVGDIIKLRIDAPLYTDPSDSNSLIYTPAAPLLTYAISWIVGKPTSIITWRIIQLCFVGCAALIGTWSCFELHLIAYPERPICFHKTGLILALSTLFLAATAPGANNFVHCLHADALALLVSAVSFWTILYYLKSPSWKRIVLMAVCPVVGYLVKQFLISWEVVILVFLLVHNHKNIKRMALFLFISLTGIGLAIFICYLLWNDNFIFWTFEVMGGTRSKIGFSPNSFQFSIIRSVDHCIRVWPAISIGFVGGLLILRGRNIRKLGSLWIAWIVLMCGEAFTSGAGWGALYHFGPGIFIGTILLLSGLARFWSNVNPTTECGFPALLSWSRPLLMVWGILTVFVALHVVPTGDRNEARYWKGRPSADVYRYISDIEKEFEGLPVQKVLLDVGNWIYLRQSYLAKDRAVSLADQPLSDIYENFDLFVDRIRKKTYEKILVRDFYSPYFLYDFVHWEKPSGVKKALLEYYKEVRTIPGIEGIKGDTSQRPGIIHSGPISVFIPK